MAPIIPTQKHKSTHTGSPLSYRTDYRVNVLPGEREVYHNLFEAHSLSTPQPDFMSWACVGLGPTTSLLISFLTQLIYQQWAATFWAQRWVDSTCRYKSFICDRNWMHLYKFSSTSWIQVFTNPRGVTISLVYLTDYYSLEAMFRLEGKITSLPWVS